MAYTAPTVDDFMDRFGAYQDADEYLLALLLAEALTQVDDSWLEQDYKNAILYLMAHMYVQETGSSATRPGTIVSESFGPMSITYGTGGVVAATDLDATEYGRRFKALRRKNFPGIAST